ncbi:MAG: type II toxin-antitoxin system death-on-curing family toxin [Proteobacteria bacterium]|nr:type II toxin-antitoxin system death-on-curing family toxin [Pseudomonadota bacterium]MCL2308299.1 type II toxin-antitoxin system death-on-curing family toxin [Pseudomonadota bacterium]
MNAWHWISASVVYAIHDRQLAEHGGLNGIRDKHAIEAALVRPQQLHSDGNPDAADLAASYAYGLARNHGFMDGNKRTAWVAARLFLALNGYQLDFGSVEAIRTVEALAAGSIEEEQLAHWFRERIKA